MTIGPVTSGLPVADSERPCCGELGIPDTRIRELQRKRDHELAALAEVYLPRMRRLVDDWEDGRVRIWEEHEQAVRDVRRAA